ncbi:M20 metallopeptidase family protein [Streptomyces sp. URMC 124]|uniref:M20 metallopeptidase family protein n=1 Tax=Streptomyces sp. URMC 124 TaxID=3423405 RepID=UPI003F1D41AB
MTAAGTAEALADHVVRVRRTLHAEPETGLDNPRTRELILAELAGIGGLEVRSGTRGTSVVARLSTGRPGGRVVLRADTDALPVTENSGEEFASRTPGVAHSCGHDAHVAMLLGAARLLAGRREELRGEVLFVFQPGEEGHDGALAVLEDEAFADLLGPGGADAAFAIHVTPNLPSGVVAARAGTLMASADGFRAEVGGRGGHAAMPALAVNPVPPLADLAGRLSALTAQGEDPVLTVTSLQAGATHNVIPDSGRLLFTLRCLDEDTRAKTLDRVRAEVAATGGGTTTELSSIVAYPCTVNDADAVATARTAASGVPGLAWVDLPAPVMASEDFSYFLQRWPGCMVLLGACPPGEPDPMRAPGCHTPEMRLDESVLARGAELHAAVAAAVCNR